ncbi:ribosome maturation factor RimM [Mycoplasmatota bacterium WC30]
MEYLKIGKIVNTRGIKGELKIKSFTDFQEDRYKKGNKVYIKYENKYLEFEVLKYRYISNNDILLLKDNEDINLVEKYIGCEISVLDDCEITLFEDEYHISEIVGLKVYQSKKHIGEIYGVVNYPQGDYLDILVESGKHSFVPFRDEFVLEVNPDDGFVEIIEMEGLV